MNGENNCHSVCKPEEMEQRLTYWIEQLHKRAPESIGDLLHFRVGLCNPGAGEYSFYASTEPWMQNAFGSLHGGVISTALDQGMGMLATCLMEGKAITPTVQMNITYHHPLAPGNDVLLKIYVESVTRTMIHMRGEAMNREQPDKLCAAATGIFYIKEPLNKSTTAG